MTFLIAVVAFELPTARSLTLGPFVLYA